MKKLTYQMLQAKGACEGQVELFKELFPDGAEVSVDVAVSVADKFDFEWAAYNLLSRNGFSAFEEAKVSLLKAFYHEAMATCVKVHSEARTLYRKAYDEAMAPHRKAYKKAIAPYEKAYKKAIAKTFAEAYIKENLE